MTEVRKKLSLFQAPNQVGFHEIASKLQTAKELNKSGFEARMLGYMVILPEEACQVKVLYCDRHSIFTIDMKI